MSEEYFEIKEKDYITRKACKARFVLYKDGSPSFSTSKLTETFLPYTNIEYIKNDPTILWLDFCKIDEQNGFGDSHSSTIIKKRVYFGELKKLSEVSDVEKYPTMGWYPESGEMVVLSRDGKVVSPIPETCVKSGFKMEVLSQEDLNKIKSIEPFRSSLNYIDFIAKGSKRLVDEHPDIVKSIVEEDVLGK